MDQAAGLRQWASQQATGSSGCPAHVIETLVALAREETSGGAAAAASAPGPARSARHAAGPDADAGATTLLVIGLPERHLERVRGLLAHWQQRGRRWVGDPGQWRLVPVAAESPHLPLLAEQQSHWALWVEADAEAFRRTWRLLLALAERAGPRRLLLVHPPGIDRRGLLDNLQQAAAHYLGIQLVVLA
ncbi:hypothetical protein [Halomonas campaniensis]|uniref:hypothetical protein n=1 Tax=Halomonas campaniensis TaxID=213554 RepID=UPI003565959F